MSFENRLSNTQYWVFVDFGFEIVDTKQGSQLLKYNSERAIVAKLNLGDVGDVELLEIFSTKSRHDKTPKRRYNFKRLALRDFVEQCFEQNEIEWTKRQ